MFVLTLIAVSLICLAFNATRLIGIVIICGLLYVYPPLLTSVLVMGSVGLIFYFIFNMGK